MDVDFMLSDSLEVSQRFKSMIATSSLCRPFDRN